MILFHYFKLKWVTYSVTKIYYQNLQIVNAVNTIKCPGFGETYIEKTDRCLITRLNEHSTSSYQPIFQHLQHCGKFLETMTLY